ncbi:MAG: hypothetical protein NC078_08385 [Ruminococcus sp.]|nr:hypothetical protein [Ruminococcus sp.]
MNIKKTAALVLGMLMLSACSGAEAEVSGTSAEIMTEMTVSERETETSAVTETSMETETTAAIEEYTEPQTAAQTEKASEKKDTEKVTREEAKAYFAEYGYKFQYSELYIDMNDCWEGGDPLAKIDKKYFRNVYGLTVENAGNKDLSFLKNYHFYSHITIENYSGNADLGSLSFNSLILDDYKGGDLSTLANSGISWIWFSNYSGKEDLSVISQLDNIKELIFENYDDDTDFGFIANCPNITSLQLDNPSVDAKAAAELLKKTNIKELNVITENYSSEDAELLMRTAPECAVKYIMDDSPWNYRRKPHEGATFYTNLFIAAETNENTPSAETGYISPRNAWQYYDRLVNVFSNNSDEECTVSSAKMYKIDGDSLIPMPFADGSYTLETDISIAPDGWYTFEITGDMFRFTECEAGIYKIVFDAGGEKSGQHFAICNFDDNLLTEEQLEIMDKAYEITDEYFGCSTHMSQEYADSHTAEEFLENLYPAYTREYAYSKSLGKYIDENGNLKEVHGDRGGDITV